MKKLLVTGLVMLGSLGVIGNTVADTVYKYTVNMNPGDTYPASAITDFQPAGSAMSGMVVTVLFGNDT